MMADTKKAVSAIIFYDKQRKGVETNEMTKRRKK